MDIILEDDDELDDDEEFNPIKSRDNAIQN